MDPRTIDYRKIIIDKKLVRDEWCRKHKQETREDIRTRRSEYFMEKWNEDFPGYEYINYVALLELANRSDKIGRWFAEKDAEFNASLTFPEWASKGLDDEKTVKLQDTFRNINDANRQSAEMKRKLSVKVKEMVKDIDLDHQNKLAKAFNGDEKAFILTYPKNQLPIHLMLSIVQFNDDFKKWKQENPDSPLGERVTPADYESNLLDSFRREMWELHMEGGSVKEFLEKLGVDFYIPITSAVAPGHLSRIIKVLE